MTAAVCIGLFALGFLNRDGFPATGETQLARFVGAFWCMGGAAAVLSPVAAFAVGLAIWLGFYTDQKHAEGQQARDWKDAGYLALSGVTSLTPLVVALSTRFLDGGAAGWLVGLAFVVDLKVAAIGALVGLVKVPVYFAAWRLFGENENGQRVPPFGWAQPTRIAAIVFGAVVGAAVSVLGGV